MSLAGKLLLAVVLSCGLLSGAWAEGAKPDIDVTYIERAPLYPAYAVGYDIPDLLDLPVLLDAQTRQPIPLGEATNIKRQPQAGEKVTFTAHVINKGEAKLGAWKFQWLLDDKPFKQGTHEGALMPAQEGTETCEWTWQAGAHRLRFVADPAHEVLQTSQANDSREVATDAWLLLWGVDAQTYDSFNHLVNHAGTRSFEDWAQWHVDKMNQLFQTSPSPLNPRGGARVRVACGKIVVVQDTTQPWVGTLPAGAFTPQDAGYDGAWLFGRAADTAKWASAPDWGLIHEWGHQLGLTDENGLDRAGAQNMVRDTGNDPLLIGYASPLSRYMMHTPGDALFSPLSMAALETQYGKRRGYYGDYHCAMPQTNVLIVTDAQGKPVPDARVTFWQDTDGAYGGEAAFVGLTDGEGKMVLPNRSSPRVTTEDGFTLHDNPFGQISFTGARNVFFIRIAARGQTDYAWLDVADVNLAYFNNVHNIATFTRATHIPPPNALPPPSGLKAEVSGEDVTLTWEAIGGAKSYRVYRSKSDSWEWETVGENIGDTVCKTKLGMGAISRYAVVAVNADGAASAFSNVVGAMKLRQPWGIAVTRTGRRILRDLEADRPILQKANGSMIGMAGPEEARFDNAFDVVVDSKGRIITTRGKSKANPLSGFVVQNADLTVAARVLNAPGSEPGHFQRPMGAAVDSQDNIFICDTDNDRIQEFSPDGKFKRVVGEGLVKQPMKLAVDRHDNLIICDTANDRLTVLRKDADKIYRLHGHANNLPRPMYIILDADGRFFVSCQGDHSIALLNNQFYRLQWAYNGPSTAPLQAPRGLAIYQGHLIVVDGGNPRVLETPLPH